MKILIEQVELCEPGHKLHGGKVNIIIESGVITHVGDDQPTVDRVIDGQGVLVSPGWMDFRAFVGEPGMEEKETLSSFCKAASAGGFTSALLLANTQPVIQSTEQVVYLQQKAAKLGLNTYYAAALSKDAKGEELTEMLDMFDGGVRVFSDGMNTIDSPDLLLKALKYAQKVGALITNQPQDPYLRKRGEVREGDAATRMGMHGIPFFSEVLMIQRDLRILEYTGGKLHFSCVTTKEGVEEIKKAKEKGLNVSCDVAAHYLVFDDESIEKLDSNLKVSPPFSSKEDVDYLKKALKEGVIDTICSDHRPQNIEEKMLEYDKAGFGIASIELTYPWANTFGGLTSDEWVRMVGQRSYELAGIESPSVQEGKIANLTLFKPTENVHISASNLKAKSKNIPTLEDKLNGKVIGTIHKDVIHVEG